MYSAEIGRAIVNFRGPIVFCVISRYHGGAFVVFPKTLNPNMTAAAQPVRGASRNRCSRSLSRPFCLMQEKPRPPGI